MTAVLNSSAAERVVTRFASRVAMKNTRDAAATTIAAPTSSAERRTERSSVWTPVGARTTRVNLQMTVVPNSGAAERVVTRFAAPVVMKSTMNAEATTIAAPASSAERRTERSSV